ncbi:MAG: phosphoribosylaminoimidazolesuccinocarboxamide synthase [Nitrospirae bacterium]|nr:MAG: phosphoribosylaminoimidazolesuccinocarboxamide synthase [Nitrospirota bacterium]
MATDDLQARIWDQPAVFTTDLSGVGPKRQGKVRDIYDLGDCLLLIATDRISAFDVVLPEGIPGKGYVLTQLSKFWFDHLWQQGDLIPHHLRTMDPDAFPESCRPYRTLLAGRSMLVEKVEPLPVECIVRGYLAGSAWKEYRTQGTVCGQPLPAGLRESDCLPEPVFTPSTKAQEGHDENIPFARMQQMIGVSLAEQVKQVCLTLYTRAQALAEERGIIIADTKFEFGIHPQTHQLMVIDELLTPDSSRFWPKDLYQPGRSQPSFDKQYVRDYLDSIGWDHRPPPPHLPPEVVKQTSEKYREALERFL